MQVWGCPHDFAWRDQWKEDEEESVKDVEGVKGDVQEDVDGKKR
jgi:hypothetical protein